MINELATVVPHLLGISWMDPVWLLDRFGQTLFWLSLVMIFVECGLFFPFLPGDTLLFAMGIFISADKIKIFQGGHHLDLPAALVLFTVAAILGNVVGYEIGRLIGQPLAHRDGRIMKKQYFDQTHEFFEKHGNKALVIGRFVPFVRTYVTVVAGITQLDRRRFLTWSTVGASLWVFSITLLGFFLGKKVPWLRDQIDTVTLGILALSALPIGIEWLRHRRRRGAKQPTSEPASSDVSDVEV